MLSVLAACAGQQAVDEFEGKPWEVLKTQLPSYPRPENLLRVHAGQGAAFAFFVDQTSVSVGQDGIIRYTLVARSEGGAVNVSYEGLRCIPLERKPYAFGRPDGTWSPAKLAQWLPISGTQGHQHYAALAEEFFCPMDRPVRTAGEAIRALRRGNIPGLAPPILPE
jgi:hypothetical protein